MIIISAPVATGNKIKLSPFPPKIAIIGFAPAGGWIVFVIIIAQTDIATANPIDRKLIPKKK